MPTAEPCAPRLRTRRAAWAGFSQDLPVAARGADRRRFGMRPRLLVPAVLALIVPACVGDPDLGTAQGEVIGGQMTPEGQFPGVGALYLPSFGGTMCTGTLIAPDVVLTAGHCVEPLFIGTEIPGFTLAHDTVTSQPAFVPGMRTMQHPMFDIMSDPGTGIGTWYDVGLVFLSEPITSVAPIKLPNAADGAMLTAGTQLKLVGYGRTSNATQDVGVMYDAVAPIVTPGPTELQISNPGDPQNCNGDSGGPALIDLGAGYRVVGIVSRSANGAECTQGGVDTRVDAYLDFIYAQTGVCADGDARCTPDASLTGGPDADPIDDPGTDGGGCCSTSRGNAAGSALLALAVGLVTLRRRRSIRRAR